MTVKIKHFVGVDVSKKKLDLVFLKENVFEEHFIIENSDMAVNFFLNQFLKKKGVTWKNTVFCMEETGIYINFLMKSVLKKSSNLVIENAYHIKNSLGLKRDKSDKLDAHCIALYAWKNRENLKFYLPKRKVVETLQLLERLRSKMIGLRVALTNTLDEQEIFLHNKLFNTQEELTIDCKVALLKSCQLIEEKIKQVLSSDDHIHHLMTIITSVTGIGPVTARHIILTTNEFKSINDPRKYACYAGIAPFKRSSGKIEFRARVSRIANLKSKSLLTMCAINAVKNDYNLKSYYIRRTKIDGKSKMSVINAVRNKLILRVFACVNQDRLYVRALSE